MKLAPVVGSKPCSFPSRDDFPGGMTGYFGAFKERKKRTSRIVSRGSGGSKMTLDLSVLSSQPANSLFFFLFIF